MNLTISTCKFLPLRKALWHSDSWPHADHASPAQPGQPLSRKSSQPSARLAQPPNSSSCLAPTTLEPAPSPPTRLPPCPQSPISTARQQISSTTSTAISTATARAHPPPASPIASPILSLRLLHTCGRTRDKPSCPKLVVRIMRVVNSTCARP